MLSQNGATGLLRWVFLGGSFGVPIGAIVHHSGSSNAQDTSGSKTSLRPLSMFGPIAGTSWTYS